MAIDILNIQPSVIDASLKGKYCMIYGSPKGGKTSLACSFPKNLLLAFEKGYNAIGGVKAVDITKWSDVKIILKQLEKAEAKEMYDTITIDTVAIAWDLCEQFICSQENVQRINDIPWGQGFTRLTQEFEAVLRRITMLGYGLVLITHSDIRRETVNGNEVEYYAPALNKRCYPICNKIVDLIAYIDIEWNEDGTSERYLYTRKTPHIMAGSRFKYLEPKIKLGYQELVDAIAAAVKKSAELDGAVVVNECEQEIQEELNYNELMTEARTLWTQLVGTGDDANEEIARRILKKVEIIFGRPMKLSEIAEGQEDLLNLVILDMKDMLSENNN